MRRFGAGLLLVLAGGATLAGCARPEDGQLEGPGECRLLGEQVELPAELYGSSGVVYSRMHPDVLWSHNDSGGEPILWGIDREGQVVAQVTLSGVRNRDWEDISYGPCADGLSCLYMGEIGDNAETNSFIHLYRFPEPMLSDRVTEVETFTLRYPDRPRDAEALFVTDDARGWIISKGRSEPVSLYRTPPLTAPGDTLTLEWVQDLTETAPDRDGRVTGASLSPGGGLVAVRTYLHLYFYRLSHEGLSPLFGGEGVNLLPFREPQGEAVDLTPGGEVVLTSERLFRDFPAPMSFLVCEDLPAR